MASVYVGSGDDGDAAMAKNDQTEPPNYFRMHFGTAAGSLAFCGRSRGCCSSASAADCDDRADGGGDELPRNCDVREINFRHSTEVAASAVNAGKGRRE